MVDRLLLPLKLTKGVRQVLNYGRRLNEHAISFKENWHLAPAREPQKLGGLVHPFLEAHVAERKWLSRKTQHERDLVGREGVRAAI